MRTIIEWQNASELTFALAQVEGESVGPVRFPVSLQEAAGAMNPVCFGLDRIRNEPDATFLSVMTLDAQLLARIVFPMVDSHELAALAGRFALPADWRDAGARAETAGKVWVALLEELARKPLPALDAMLKLMGDSSNPLCGIIEDAAKAALKKAFGKKERSLQDFLPDVEAPWKLARREPKDPPEPLDVDSVCNIFAPDGALARTFSTYEPRAEQVRMVREVCEAFNGGLLLMVEAGTGTGKSMAYLVPSVLWAMRNNEPVVVSTNTKNLQSQLFKKDLPFLEKALGQSFTFALIKGRANYLCARKLFMLLNAAENELSESERLELLPVLTWITETQTGDVAELSGLKGGMESELWPRLSTQPDECAGQRCRFGRRCFIRNARNRALQSDIIVANHATVFWEAGIQNVALPPYRSIIFDEAHNLESVATDAFTVEVAPWKAPRIMNRLFRPQRDGAGRGLLSNLRHQLSLVAAAEPSDMPKQMEKKITKAIEAFTVIRSDSEAFFSAVGGLLARRGIYEEKLRYEAENRPEDWPAVAHTAIEFRASLEGLAKILEALGKDALALVEERGAEGPYEMLGEIGEDVGSQAAGLREIAENVETVLNAADENRVYWAERTYRGEGRLCAAPLDITPMMEQLILGRVRTGIFVSATLTASGSFKYMRDRLGLRGAAAQRLHEADLGTCFDFARQALLALPTFLPEPKEDDGFTKKFSDLAVETLRASRGRGLLLFTSHAMLRKVRDLIKPRLEAEGIRVLAQGIDGERARLVAVFAQETSSVLLGTQSFWEGVDVPGESLSCLILAKLPFRVHTEPIVSARCDLLKKLGRNDFTEYMLPDAVVRLKQGFGRLIRTRTDRGVVVICDPRIMTKGYGQAFRNSLPARSEVYRDMPSLARAVRDFLK